VELVSEPAPDPSLFAPIGAAKELVNCPSGIKPPRQTYAPEPMTPANLHDPVLVTIGVFLGADGKLNDIQIKSAPNPDFDQAALRAIRQWTFSPATCDGEPVAMEIAIQVDFHR
jgi:protein TonB